MAHGPIICKVDSNIFIFAEYTSILRGTNHHSKIRACQETRKTCSLVQLQNDVSRYEGSILLVNANGIKDPRLIYFQSVTCNLSKTAEQTEQRTNTPAQL